MSKLLLIITAAASLAATGASAFTGGGQPRAPLPDFPRDAQPGACYARVPAGGAAPAAPGAGPAVWTVRRGAGATAVWSYSHGGAPGAPVHGPLHWAQVDCGTGQPVLGPMAALDSPPPPPVMGPHHGAGHMGAPPPPPPPPLAPRPPADDLGPYADAGPPTMPPPPPPLMMHPMPEGRPMPRHAAPSPSIAPFGHGPGPMAGLPPHHPPVAGPQGGPREPFQIFMSPRPGFAPHPPAPPPAAPWFGGRMLSWPGKTLR